MSCFRVGDWYFEPDSGELCDESQCRRLEPRVADVLRYLAERPGRVVHRRELLEDVWRDRVVVEEALSRCISLIRKAIDDERPYRILETLPRRGYRIRATEMTCQPDQ